MVARFWEIDFVRGLAILGMVIYHLFFDLRLFYNSDIPVDTSPLLLLARLTAITFIFLVGVSASFQFHSLIKHSVSTRKIIIIFITRALVIFFWALIITVVTYLLFPTEFVFFGVLHLIGLSLIILIPFLFINNKFLLFISGLIFIVTGLLIAGFNTSSHDLIWLGLRPRQFVSLDYFPLLPWFGLVLLGLLFGKVYPAWRQTHLKKTSRNIFPLITLAGRHSLSLYLLHQPILVFGLFLFKILWA